jgi:heme-degrading monooxygenase HmoA
MIVEYVRYELPPEARPAFELGYALVGPLLGNSPHCLRWELSRSVEQPASYVVRIEWDSQVGHETGFRASPDFQTFIGTMSRFAHYRVQMAHFEVLQHASHSASGRLNP